jgi:hypothetical protein
MADKTGELRDGRFYYELWASSIDDWQKVSWKDLSTKPAWERFAEAVNMLHADSALAPMPSPLDFTTPVVLAVAEMAGRNNALEPHKDRVYVAFNGMLPPTAAIRDLTVNFQCPRSAVLGLSRGGQFELSLRWAK